MAAMNMTDEEWLDFFLTVIAAPEPQPTDEDVRIFRATYDALPLRVRLTFQLHKGHGYTKDETRARLKLTEEQVERYLLRATAILAEALERRRPPISFPTWKEIVWELPLVRGRYTPPGVWPEPFTA
jgi:DNA-directed RNA polymerase specialized sigma24 family protein